ncbi:hypothetical protein JW859_11710 [bacterium]|nr:hypothetical protein [bacterium]
MLWWTDMRQDAGEWYQAWATVGENPFAMYFSIARQRQAARVPAWRRLLVYFVICGLVVLGAVIPLTIEIINATYSSSYDLEDIVSFITATLLATLSAAVLVFLLTSIYDTALAVSAVLADARSRLRGHVLDDMIATTRLTDRELVAAVVRLFWPRLILASLLCAALFWLWLMYLHMLELFLNSPTSLLVALLGSLLTIGAVTLTGALGGLLYILCLLIAGNGLTGAYAASTYGILMGLVQAVQIPATVGVTLALAAQYANSNYFDDGLELQFGHALGCAVLIVLFFALTLARMDRWPGLRPALAIGMAVLLPVGLGVLILGDIYKVLSLSGNEGESLMFNYVLSWAPFSLSFPLALPAPVCLGSLSLEHWLTEMPEFYRFPLLVLQQLVLITVALHYARRGVAERRSNLS